MLFYLLLINITAFALFWIDKNSAKKQQWRRVPNFRLLALAVLGGSIGAWLGMYVFRHKTRQRLFTIGIPLILVVQILIVAFFLFDILRFY